MKPYPIFVEIFVLLLRGLSFAGRLIRRLTLDLKFEFVPARIARGGGGIALGFLAQEPCLVAETDDSHWWYESIVVFLFFWSLRLRYSRRIVPWSPTEMFKP